MQTLLERDGELARLAGWMDDAASGHGRVVFVGGEAGIGKTSLVATFAAARRGDARVAIGRCDALTTPRALGPVVDIAVGLGLDPPTDRDALLGCLLDAVRGGGPVLAIVEDAHWADDATIELLAMVGRRAGDLALLLVVTYRDDEVPQDHPLRLAIGDLVTGRGTAWLGLAPLSRDAVRILAEPAGVAVDELYERTGGNPFYVTEALAAPGQMVPTTVRLAVLARAARLDAAARTVVDAVAIVPGRTEAWLLQTLCDPAPDAVDACIAGGVLVAAEGIYAFRHELARLAIESQLGEGSRRRLHQRAVSALTARAIHDPARIAHHAAAAGDDAALATAARNACLLAASRTAHREAIRHGEHALEVQQFLTASEIAELKVRLGPSLVAMARTDEAVTLARQAVEHWHSTGDDRREADALVGLSSALGNLGRTEDSMPPVEQAVEVLERHQPGRELATAYLRLTLAHMLARDRDAAVEWGEKAIALSIALGDNVLLGRSLIETGIADVMDGRAEGLARVRQGIAIGRRDDLPAVVASGLLQIGSGYGEMRRYGEAVPALVECAALSSAHNLEASRRYAVAWLARCRFDLGQWEEAERHARDVLAGSRDVAIARFVALNTLGWLRARRGDPDAWPLLDEALQIAREMCHLQRLWPVAIARAEAGALDGSLDEHIPLLEEVLALARVCRHGVALGEIALWLSRAGCLAEPPSGAWTPFASWIKGDHIAAASEFRRLGCPYEAASALADSADIVSLREALATFELLGAAPMARTVATELRARGVRLPARRDRLAAAGQQPSGLTVREEEVLKLVASGFTNPQIATVLYISRKTAEHHVSSILAKLGVASRTEAAAAAVRLGLAPG